VTGLCAVLSAILALGIPVILQAAPVLSREDLKYRDFEDLVRCRFIVEEVCARLQADDRAGAAAFIGSDSAADFASLPGDQGRIRSCRRIRPSKLLGTASLRPQMSLLLGYESKSSQEVGLRFGALGRWTCGLIAAIDIGPRRFQKDGQDYYDFSIQSSWGADGSLEWVEGGQAGPKSKKDKLAGLQPERDDSPRAAYLARVLEEIRAERKLRGAARDPLDRPLIQKE